MYGSGHVRVFNMANEVDVADYNAICNAEAKGTYVVLKEYPVFSEKIGQLLDLCPLAATVLRHARPGSGRSILSMSVATLSSGRNKIAGCNSSTHHGCTGREAAHSAADGLSSDAP
jgi:hypothetical protein